MGRPRPTNITKELFQKLCVDEGKSVLQVGKLIGKSAAQVTRYLKIFGIKARPFSTKGLSPQKGKILSAETRARIRAKATGRVIPPEVRRKMGSPGAKNARWIDGRTPINRRIRHSVEYKLWRQAVFTRDRWTCVFCGIKGGDIHADHIKPFAHFPELRFSIDNGRTLCVPCHRATDTYGWKLLAK